MNIRITIDPTICHGKPVIKNTRVLVSNILSDLADGLSFDDIIKSYPNITEDLDIPVSPKKRRGCGGPKSGTEMAFIPPIGFKLASMARRRRKWWIAFVKWLNTL